MKKLKGHLSIFSMVLMSLSAVLNLRSLPILAVHGLSSIFYYTLAILFFMMPYALTTAHLAAIVPGGIFMWVRKAFGLKWGFVAVWFQWFHRLAWYPAILAFWTVSAYRVFFPNYPIYKLTVFLVIITIFWLSTLAAIFYYTILSYVTRIFFFLGTVIPAAFLIVLALVWLIKGYPCEIVFSWKNILPPRSGITSSIAMITSIFFSLSGLESTSAFVPLMKKPRKNYPKAIFLAGSFMLTFLICGTLAIAIVIPKEDVKILGALTDSLGIFFNQMGISWADRVVLGLVVIGMSSQFNTWIISSSKGLWNSAQAGCLPKFFVKTNKLQTPVNILLFQAVTVTVFTFFFFFLSDIGAGFWLLNVLSTQMYLLMYVFLLLSAPVIHLRFPELHNDHGLFKGKIVVWGVSMVGLVSIIAALCVSFLPPHHLILPTEFVTYRFSVIASLIFCLFLPFYLYEKSKKRDK